MADFNMNTRLHNIDAINGLVRENLAQPPQSKLKAEGKAEDKAEVDKRQELASKNPPSELAKSLDDDESREKLNETITKLNDSLQNVQRNLKFSVDEDAGRIVINVTDKETDKVLRQIPSEDVLELARNLQEVNERLNEPVNEHNESRSQPTAEGVFLKTSV